MKTHPIVPELNVPRNILLRLLSRRVSCPVDALDFQGGVKGFGQRIVVAYPGPPYGLADPEPFQGRRELGGGIVAAAVRMKNSISGKAEVAGGHLYGGC